MAAADFDAGTYHSNLLSIARRYVETLQGRPGLQGVVLYGSLSGPIEQLTPFSDIDLVLLMEEPLPPYFSEHRLVEGVKLDSILLSAQKVQDLGQNPPESLYQHGWLIQFLVKSFLVGGEETLLFDPAGRWAELRNTLRSRLTYRGLALTDTRRWLTEAEEKGYSAARTALEQNHLPACLEHLREFSWVLLYLPHLLAADKDLDRACRHLNAPDYAVLAGEFKSRLTPLPSDYKAFQRACSDLNKRMFAEYYGPLEGVLKQAGIQEPDALELIGEEALFWPGYRIHTFERLKAEWTLCLKFSRYRQQKGDLYEALSLLWPFTGENFPSRCKGLASLLQREGLEADGLCTAFLESEAVQRCLKQVHQAEAACHPKAFSPEETERLLNLAGQLLARASSLLDRLESAREF